MIATLYLKFKQLFVDQQNTPDDVNQHESLIKPLFWMLLLAASSIVAVLTIDIIFGLKGRDSLGTFGDFFGGLLNPIFTFLTFFGLIVTIVIQRMELRLARQEYEKTAIALNTQAIENTFFNTLELHHKIVDGLKFDPRWLPDDTMDQIRQNAGLPRVEKSISIGRNVFDAVALEISNRASNPKDVLTEYKFLQTHHNQILGHYFRNLYQALKAIDSYSDEILPLTEKRKYSSILRAQLSSNELSLLYLNCLDDVVDDGEFRNLLIKYRMLEHLPLEYRDGVYFAGSRAIAVADEDSIRQYFKAVNIQKSQSPLERGAFGFNPIRLPCDA